MVDVIEFRTKRLLVRQWCDPDYEPFAALNADPRVMEFFVEPLDRAASDSLADRCRSLIAEQGWGLWAVERIDSEEFIGFVGMHSPPPDFPFSPCVEIGWRLAFDHWGKGFATEAARGALQVGFERLGLSEILSFTSTCNLRSQAVMRRLHMNLTDFFDHPRVPLGNRLRPHCLYRLSHDTLRVG